MSTELGKIIKTVRIKKGLSQKNLAKLTGITPVALCRIESGDTKKVLRKNLKKISNVLGIDYSDLLVISGYDNEVERVFDETYKKFFNLSSTDRYLVGLIIDSMPNLSEKDKGLIRDFVKSVSQLSEKEEEIIKVILSN